MNTTKLYKGDCLVESDKIESGSVDLILTDLPYGTVKDIKNVNHGMSGKCEWDEVINTNEVYKVANRILRKKGKEKLVVDIVDSHEMFQRQYTKRRRFYNKQNFKIMETDVKGFKKDDWTTYSRKRKTTKANSKNQPLLQGKLMFNLNDD